MARAHRITRRRRASRSVERHTIAGELAAPSARRFETTSEIVLPLHSWFLETATWFDDPRHLAMRHHSFGIIEAEQRFGIILGPTAVPTRIVAEWHVRTVLGRFLPLRISCGASRGSPGWPPLTTHVGAVSFEQNSPAIAPRS